MKILFTCSRTGFKNDEYRNYYLSVLGELKNQKVSVESTIEKTYLNKHPKLKSVKDLAINDLDYKHVHDAAIRNAIRRCDAVIIEASYPSFRLGFETFFALSLQKPVLVLSKFNNYGSLVDQPHFFGTKYTDFTLPDEIEKFVTHVRKNKLRIRFNLFISEDQKQMLDNKSKQYQVSQSDYIRGLIDKDIK